MFNASRRFATVLLCGATLLVHPLLADDLESLSIKEAVRLALTADPTVDALRLRGDAQVHLSEAAKLLPEPTVRTGFMNVPIDSFSLNAEPMTQVHVGVRQTIPPRGARAATSANHRHLESELRHQAKLQTLNTKLATRTAWLEAHYLRFELELSSQIQDLLEDLVEIARVRYAAGKEIQGVVLAAELESSRLASLLIDMRRREHAQLEELRRLMAINDPVVLDSKLPNWSTVPEQAEVVAAVHMHPRMLMSDASIAAAAAQVEIREADFNPLWHVDVNYGLRDGVYDNGSNRSDFVNATLSFTLPILSRASQQQKLGAANFDASGRKAVKDRDFRDLTSEIRTAYDDWNHLTKRATFINKSIIMQSQSHSRAALQEYQNNARSISDVVLSYRVEHNERLAERRVQIDKLLIWAKIDSLNGMTQ